METCIDKVYRLLADKEYTHFTFTKHDLSTHDVEVIVASVQRYAEIRALNLGNTPLGKESAACLGTMLKTNRTLEDFCLCKLDIADGDLARMVKSLEGNTTVRMLGFSEMKMRLPVMQRLTAMLIKNTTLSALLMMCVPVGENGVHSLSDGLHAHPAMVELHFANTQMGPDGAACVASALKGMPHLRYLDIGLNPLGRAGIHALSDVLGTNTSLMELHMDLTGLDRRSIKYLARALARNHALKTLNIGRNPIGDAGLTLLVAGLEGNTALQQLALYFNKITEKGIRVLAHALQTHLALCVLDVRHNSMGKDGLGALACAVRENCTLRVLDVRDNSTDREDHASMAEALRTNTTLVALRMHDWLSHDMDNSSMVHALRENRTLQLLDVPFARNSDRDIQNFIDACQANPAILSIWCNQHGIPTEAWAPLETILKRNRERYRTVTSLQITAGLRVIENDDRWAERRGLPPTVVDLLERLSYLVPRKVLGRKQVYEAW